MALKLIVLLLLALTITKACDLDWILEDIYDDTDSSEDESTEKPPNNQNNTAPSKPESNPPPATTSINTKPAPIIPHVADTTDSANNSTGTPASSRESRRHRRTHHRRRVLRKIPVKDQKTDLNEGRGFKTDFDEASLFEGFEPLVGRSVKELHPEERKIESNLDQTGRKLETEDFTKVLMSAFGRTDLEKTDRQEFIPVLEGPTGRMEHVGVRDEDNEEEQRDVDTSTEDDSDEKYNIFVIPEVRKETHGLKQNTKEIEGVDKRKLLELLGRVQRKKHQRPPKGITKSDLKIYIKEYLKTLILRDLEGKIDGTDDYVYVPIPKRIWNRRHNKKEPKRPEQILSMFNPHKLAEHKERIHPSFMEVLLNNNKPPSKPQEPREPEEPKLAERESILLLLSRGPSEKDHIIEAPVEHVMLQNQNPRRPILSPSDSDIHRIVDDSLPEIKFPNINHVNHVKEHILRETIKVNPVDNSEVHNVHEQTRLSIIKSPHVPIELTLDKQDPSDLKEPILKPTPLPIQKLPLMDSITNFQQKIPVNLREHGPQPLKLLFQELPFVNVNEHFKPGFLPPPQIPLLNRFGEEHDAAEEKPNSADLTKLSDISMQAHTSPVKYPINKIKPEAVSMEVEKPELAHGEDNFYVKPQIHEGPEKPIQEGVSTFVPPVKHVLR